MGGVVWSAWHGVEFLFASVYCLTPEVELPVEYKGIRLTCGYRADCACFENVLVEIKAIAALVLPNQAQLLNQLKATKHRRGILINFGAPSLEYKRMVFGTEDNLCASVKSVDQLRL